MSAQASFTNVSVQKFASEGDAALFDRNWTEHSPVLLKKLGEHEVPETPEAPKVLNNAIDVGDFIKINGMLLYRSKPDEDGDIKLELVMGMRNVSEIHFDKVELKMTLNERKGAEVEYSTDYGQLPPYSGRVMNPSIWGLSEARLKNCTVNISLDIYQPVAYATSTATLHKY